MHMIFDIYEVRLESVYGAKTLSIQVSFKNYVERLSTTIHERQSETDLYFVSFIQFLS